MVTVPTYTVYRYTATADTAFNIVNMPVWARDVSIFILTNSCDIGDKTQVDTSLTAGTIYSLDGPLNLFDLMFKNTTPGSNTQVKVHCIRLSDREIAEKGLM